MPGNIARMPNTQLYVAFVGARCVAEGSLADVLPVLRHRYEKDPTETVLTFQTESGRQLDFDLRPPIDEILEREGVSKGRGPGRPRLGVVSREVSLLPRHWDWLEQQPQGLSAALRRLVEHAIKNQPGKQRAARIRAATCQILTALAGNRPHFEEACRALFAGDEPSFSTSIERWPKDIAQFARERMQAALAAEGEDQ